MKEVKLPSKTQCTSSVLQTKDSVQHNILVVKVSLLVD